MKKILFALLLITITIGAVSATENMNSTDNIDLNMSFDDSNEFTSSEEDNFKNLSELIKNSDEINLTKDYTYNEVTDSDFKEGITIDKDLTINGQGHIICGNFHQAFTIKQNNITLKNIIFKNTRINSIKDDLNIINCRFEDCNSEEGGAIYSNGNNLTIANSSFKDCMAEDYGAIYSNGNNLNIASCNFTGCIAYGSSGENKGHFGHGGAIYSKGKQISLTDCRFKDCNGENGGAIYLEANNINVTNCGFTDCSAIGDMWRHDSSNYMGGAIYCDGNNILITDSNFKNDAAGLGGGIYVWGSNCDILNCIFTSCSAVGTYPYDGPTGDGGAVCFEADKCSVAKSTFNKCTADYGGAVSSSRKTCDISKCNFISCSAKYKNEPVRIRGVELSYDMSASNLKMFYNDGTYFKVKTSIEGSNIASGLTVTFKLDGKTFKTVKTDKNGYAKIKITSLPKTYKITAKLGTASITKKLTVRKVLSLNAVKVKKSAKKLLLTATLKKGKTPLTEKAVTFKFNGKTYKAKTNSKGIAKATIKSGELKKLKVGKKVTYQATYVKNTVKKTVKVMK